MQHLWALVWNKTIRVCGLVHLFAGYNGLLSGSQDKLQFTGLSAHIKICWDFLRSGRGEVFRAACSHTGFYTYMNNIIYNCCRLKESPSSNQWKRRSRTAPSVVQAVFCQSPYRLLESALEAEASCMESLYSIFKGSLYTKANSFWLLWSLTLPKLPLLLLHHHTPHSKPLPQNTFVLKKPVSSWNKTPSTTLTGEAEAAIFQIIRCISKCTYSLSMFVKPILKLGFEMAENCMLGLSLRGWRGREGQNTVWSRNKEKGRVLFFKYWMLL